MRGHDPPGAGARRARRARGGRDGIRGGRRLPPRGRVHERDRRAAVGVRRGARASGRGWRCTSRSTVSRRTTRHLEAVALVGEVVDSRRRTGPPVRARSVTPPAAGWPSSAAQQAEPQVREGMAGLLLVAPWIDLTMTNPAVDAVERTDPWLTRAGLHPIAQSWAGDLALDDPRVSPLFGDLTDLPPVEVWVGTRDITLPDCRELERRMPVGAAFRAARRGRRHPRLPPAADPRGAGGQPRDRRPGRRAGRRRRVVPAGVARDHRRGVPRLLRHGARRLRGHRPPAR